MEVAVAILTVVVVLLVAALVAVLIIAPTSSSSTASSPKDPGAPRGAPTERAAAARAALPLQWASRPYLHAALVTAAIQGKQGAVVASLERLGHQAGYIASLYTDAGSPAPGAAAALAAGLAAYDKALLEATQFHAVGDTPSYTAAVAAGAAAHTAAVTSVTHRAALKQYHTAMIAHVRAAVRDAHSIAHMELDKAALACQAMRVDL